MAASVDETTIRQVKAGQTAAITFDAFPGQSFTGQVLSVPLQGTLEGGVMVYTVPVSLTGAEKLALRVGMTANVEIKVADITDALLYPPSRSNNPMGNTRCWCPRRPIPTARHKRSPSRSGQRRNLHADPQGPERRGQGRRTSQVRYIGQ